MLNELDEVRANKVKVILADQGIAGRKIRIGSRWNIAVDSDQVDSALRVIDSSRLLTRELTRVKPDSAPLFRSRGEKEQQMLRTAADELAQTIEGIPGVLEAHVHLYRPAADALDPALRAGSASLLAVLTADCKIDSPAMVQLISGATGIEPARVAVNLIMPFETVPAAGGSEPGSPVPGSSAPERPASERTAPGRPVGPEPKNWPAPLLPPATRSAFAMVAGAGCLILLLKLLIGRFYRPAAEKTAKDGRRSAVRKFEPMESRARLKPRPADPRIVKPEGGADFPVRPVSAGADSIEERLPMEQQK